MNPMIKTRLEMFITALDGKEIDYDFLRKQYVLLKKELDVLLA
jgi:hypothetical protein